MTTQREGITTLQGLLDARFGIKTETRDNPVTATAGTGRTLVLRANPSRIAFTITNLGTNFVFLWSDAEVSSTRGVRINGNGGSAQVLFDEDFARVGYNWFVIADTGTSAISIQEVLIGGA